MARFKDYDAAVQDLDPEEFEFILGGRDFVAPIDIDAAQMLSFLRLTASTNAGDVAKGMRAVLGDEIWNYLFFVPVKDDEVPRPDIGWIAIRELVNDLAVYYGGGIVGAPKAVVDPQLVVSPQMEEEPSQDTSTDTSGSSTDGSIWSDEEPETTVSASPPSSDSPGDDS